MEKESLINGDSFDLRTIKPRIRKPIITFGWMNLAFSLVYYLFLTGQILEKNDLTSHTFLFSEGANLIGLDYYWEPITTDILSCTSPWNCISTICTAFNQSEQVSTVSIDLALVTFEDYCRLSSLPDGWRVFTMLTQKFWCFNLSTIFLPVGLVFYLGQVAISIFLFFKRKKDQITLFYPHENWSLAFDKFIFVIAGLHNIIAIVIGVIWISFLFTYQEQYMYQTSLESSFIVNIALLMLFVWTFFFQFLYYMIKGLSCK